MAESEYEAPSMVRRGRRTARGGLNQGSRQRRNQYQCCDRRGRDTEREVNANRQSNERRHHQKNEDSTKYITILTHFENGC